MSKGINKVIIVGNVGSVDIKAKEGFKVANISIATSEFWKDRDGNNQQKTEWHRCVCFNKLADVAETYVMKGNKLAIEGKLQTRKWQDKDGRDVYTTEIVISDIVLLGNKFETESDKREQVETLSTVNFDDDIPF